MFTDNSVYRCADAVAIIDDFLLANQNADSYDLWLVRSLKHPSEHIDAFLFGKLVQAIFSGGMNSEVVDNWMPHMEKVFHYWDMEWISKLSENDIESLIESGKVISNRSKLRAIVKNAGIVLNLISKHETFGQYLASFNSITSLSSDIVDSCRFPYLKEVTVQDFLRNIGFDTAKPDRHLTRWLKRMQAIDEYTSTDHVLKMIYTIAETANVSRAKFDAIIYLFCANRHDVLENGGVCGNIPNCGLCPITALCPRNIVSKVVSPSRNKTVRSVPKKPKRREATLPKSDTNTVWNTKYPGMSIEEVRQVNPFVKYSSWLNEPYRGDITPGRRRDMEKLFDKKTKISKAKIKEFGDNKGEYVAFRAIAHEYAVWRDEALLRCT